MASVRALDKRRSAVISCGDGKDSLPRPPRVDRPLLVSAHDVVLFALSFLAAFYLLALLLGPMT